MKRLIVVLLIICMTLPMLVLPSAASEVPNSNPMDMSKIEDDLAGATISGKPFNMADYSFKENATDVDGQPTMNLLSFWEYGYSDVDESDLYSLYMYVYNPSNIHFSKRDVRHTVTIALEPNRYQRFPMKLVDYCGTEEHEYLLLKFKVAVKSEDLYKCQNASKGSRTYDVSEFRIADVGAYGTSLESEFSNSYTFTGTMKGFGKDKEADTLMCMSSAFETLHLDLHSTYYRPDTPRVGKTSYYSQLNTAYFSVPNSLLEKYGDLFDVHFDAWIYDTKPVYVFSRKNYEAYEKLITMLGQNTGEKGNEDFGYKVFGFIEGNPHSQEIITDNKLEVSTSLGYVYYWVFNDDASVFDTVSSRVYDMFWLIYNENNSNEDMVVSGASLEKYAETFLKEHGAVAEYDLIVGKYPSFLFDVPSGGFEKGYQEFHATVGENQKLTFSEYVENNWFYETLFGYEFSSIGKEIETIKPLDSVDFYNLTPEQFCKANYVSEADYNELKNCVEKAEANDETTFLIRHSVTDYQVYSAFVDEVGEMTTLDGDDGSFIAKQTVFLDLGVIDVSFKKDGVITVIPTVASPIDVFNDVTHAPDVDTGMTWWQVLLVLLAVVVIVIVLVKFIGPVTSLLTLLVKGIAFVLKWAWLIISWPVRAIINKIRK